MNYFTLPNICSIINMDESHKELIRLNFRQLVKTNVDASFTNSLIEKGVFTQQEIADLPIDGRRVRLIYLMVQSKGKDAFFHLVQALVETQQFSMAKCLDPKVIQQNPTLHCHEIFREGAHPFQLPNYTGDVAQLIRGFSHTNISLRQEPLQINVTPCENFNHSHAEMTPQYRNESINRGLVCIINNAEVAGEIPRRGSEHDVNNLRQIFEQTGMVVDVRDTENILQEVTEFVWDERLRTADIVVLVIMTHGTLLEKTEYLKDKDGSMVATDKINALFTNRECPYMRGKPKIILYQVCRGNMKDTGVLRTAVDGSPPPAMPSECDVLVIYATLRNYVAHRDIYMGSWFIQLFCETYMKWAHMISLQSMLVIANEDLKKQRSAKGTIQVAEYHNIGFKTCYFNPGIYLGPGGQVCKFEK